MSAIYLVNKDY